MGKYINKMDDNNKKSSKGKKNLKQSKYKSYDELPLMLFAMEVAVVLGVSRSSAYELVKEEASPL